MKLAARIVPMAIALGACSPEPAQEDAQPVEAPIPTIKGHELHNQLATAPLGFRNLYLSRILRGMGEDCMVVDRSMYQGFAEDLGSSLWSAHCENGSEWGVSVNKDGSGSILKCEEMAVVHRALEEKAKSKIKGMKCWERYKD